MIESYKVDESETFESLHIAAELLLSRSLNKQIHIHQIERLTEKGRRNLLLRCFIDPVKGTPSSFILKKVEAENYNPDDAQSEDTRRLFNDWVGSQFLNTIPGKFNYSPRFYGGDRNLGFILIEDVQHCNSLVEPLLGSDRTKAERALLKYATCLAQLHGNTLGKVREFEQLYQNLSPNMQLVKTSVNIYQHQLRLENLGIKPESKWLTDLETIHQTVSNPGKFLAYIHTDACPDNVLDTGQELRLIDFETGYFGHAFIDAACGRMMFPSCWCSKRLPHAVVQQMENTYRATLRQYCSIADNDEIFAAALVDACGWWLLYTLSRHLKYALRKDGYFGISTIRQRILTRLEVFIATSQEFNRLTGLRNMSRQLLDLLRQRWTDVADLPLYPAFCTLH